MQIKSLGLLIICILISPMVSCSEEAPEVAQEITEPAGPRLQPGTEMGIYTPEQHDLYTGRFLLSAGSIHQVGGLNDPPGWDHIDNAAERVSPVEGTVEIDVNEIDNTGTFIARLKVPEGDLVIEMDRFHEFSPCQNGGVAAYIFEHGDSGCGDSNWPKSFLYVAGWGYGHATLNGDNLYEEYQVHFMVTQGMRDRDTLKVNYPLLNKKSPAGAVNPAAQQLDFFIRSPEVDEQNNPTRKVFDHFFAMEVTWK
ncbi:hypothetical protein MYX82_08835 [Acidobacteria bacterium AH-259-D05]|nr:hypothetical protein [Acidobacteria bacterium AH-259-D05]